MQTTVAAYPGLARYQTCSAVSDWTLSECDFGYRLLLSCTIGPFLSLCRRLGLLQTHSCCWVHEHLSHFVLHSALCIRSPLNACLELYKPYGWSLIATAHTYWIWHVHANVSYICVHSLICKVLMCKLFVKKNNNLMGYVEYMPLIIQS